MQGYRTERPEPTARAGDRGERPVPPTRVTVELVNEARTASLRFLAHARVPSEGAWSIPALRPLDATWTGGRTTVVLDDSHALRACRERAGRLVPPGRGDAAPANRLTFEAESPRSVAELVFIRPRADVACTVLGRLVMGGAQPRLDCRLDWVLHRGSVSQMEIDLAPTWLPEQVRIQGLDDPLAWHSSAMPSGATRLRVMLPASVLARGRGRLSSGATSTAPTGRGPLELPRVHPVGAAIVDEAWLAWVDDGTMIRPDRARGLAWIDPVEVPGLVTAPPASGLRESLGWRWTAEAAEARVERERIDQDPRASIRARARLAPDGRGLSVEGLILVGSGAAALDILPIWVDGPGDPLASWHFAGEDGGELRLRPIEGPARARLDLPGNASLRGLPVNLPPLAEKAVRFRANLPWSSPGVVPLLGVPREFLKGGTILLETPAGIKAFAPVDRRFAWAGSMRRRPPLVAGPRTLWTNQPPARRRVRATGSCTPSRTPSPAPGWSSRRSRWSLRPCPASSGRPCSRPRWTAGGRTLNRLRGLLAQPRSRRGESLDLELPEGATPVRARRDGNDVVPIRSGSRLSIPAAAGGLAGR